MGRLLQVSAISLVGVTVAIFVLFVIGMLNEVFFWLSMIALAFLAFLVVPRMAKRSK